MTYTRDTLGRITAVSATVNGVATPITTNRTYRADGLLLSQTYGNGLNETRQYDQKGQLTYQSLGTADTRVYGYDPTGNLTTKQSLPEVASYGYDVLDRLVHEATAALTGSFGYDTNGNRLSASFNNLNTTLGYSNRLTQVSAYGQTLPVALDASGNTVGLPSLALALAYDEAGRLTAIERSGSVIARYVYNAHGQRTRKTAGDATTVYHYDLAGNLIAETQVNGTPIRAYVQADDSPLAQLDRAIAKKTAADRLIYLHGDALSTPRLATDATGTVVWGWEGEAFGSAPPNEDPDRDGKKTIINLRYAGQYFDQETGLFYNWHRYYSPVLGRYISPDRMGPAWHVKRYVANLGVPGQPPLELNPYVYTANNPLRWIDPTGLWSITAGGYIGWGGEVSFGRDANTGGGFLTGRVGFGLGGGISWQPGGTRPGSRPNECNTGGWGVGGFGDLGFNLGPLQAGLQSNAGVNFNNNGGPSPYGQLLNPSWGFGDSWGIKAGGAIGVEGTLYSPAIPR